MTFHSLIIANERSLINSLIPFLSENLSGKFQLYFGRKVLVELLDVNVIDIIALRRLINTGNAVQISVISSLQRKKESSAPSGLKLPTQKNAVKPLK